MIRMIILAGIFLVCSVDAIPLRDYCDNKIYKAKGSPKFWQRPQKYILPYYKRCLDHKKWVDCIVKTRKKKPKHVTMEWFQNKFPDRESMRFSGWIFCDSHLKKTPARHSNCVFNSTMCNQVYEYKDACRAHIKKVTCVWGQLMKCRHLEHILEYEMRMLGGECEVRWLMYWRSAMENTGPASTEPSTPLVLTLCCIILLTALFKHA